MNATIPTTENANCLHHFVELYGNSTHSYLSLYPGVQYFTQPALEGFIPYVVAGQMVLMAGEPICASRHAAPLVKAFVTWARRHYQRVGCIPVSAEMKTVFDQAGFDHLYIGKEPIFKLNQLPKHTASIRQAIRRAHNKGLQVVPYSAQYQAQVAALCAQWQQTHELPPMQFLFQLLPLQGQADKQYFLLVDPNETLLAFLACSPIYGRNGWYLEDLVRTEHAPNGATELLVTHALKTFSEQGYDMASLALAPLAGLPDHDEQHPLFNHLLRLGYEHLSFVYHFQSLEFFKRKFRPTAWEPNYFCFYPQGVSMGLIRDLMVAFMPPDIPGMVRHKLHQTMQQIQINLRHQRLYNAVYRRIRPLAA